MLAELSARGGSDSSERGTRMWGRGLRPGWSEARRGGEGGAHLNIVEPHGISL